MKDQTKIYTSPLYGRGCITEGKTIQFRWFSLLFIFFFVPTIFGMPFIAKMIGSGEGLYLFIFLVAFISSLYINLSVVFRISHETDVLLQYYNDLSVNTDFEKERGSIIANHIRSLKIIFKRSGGQSLSQDSLIEILHAKLKGEESMVILFSNLMITLGLVGTISGLITTVGGIGSDSGIKEALGGMGTAFYTTLLGSMLGGITLRVLHFYVDKKVDSYILNLAEIIEIRVMPQFQIKQKKKGLKDIAVATICALRDMEMLKEEDNEICSFRITA